VEPLRQREKGGKGRAAGLLGCAHAGPGSGLRRGRGGEEFGWGVFLFIFLFQFFFQRVFEQKQLK